MSMGRGKIDWFWRLIYNNLVYIIGNLLVDLIIEYLNLVREH